MTTHEHKRGFVGQPIRRFEDPALVTGRGRFSGDLAAAHWVRFVRSPVASRADRGRSPRRMARA